MSHSLSKKKTPKDKALEHFDDFYQSVFTKQWPSIRLALLSPNQCCAVVNNYSDVERIVPHLESLGAINLKRLFDAESERLKENKKSKKRDKEIRAISQLNERLEKFSLSKKEEEMDKLYPQGARTVEEPNQWVESPSDRFINKSNSTALYEFVPTSRLKGMEGWVPESQYYSYYGATATTGTVDGSIDGSIDTRVQSCLHFPQELRIYLFEPGNIDEFPTPGRGMTGVEDYCLLDGADILPVLALDLQPGDSVLDMYASLGYKSLICLQTLYPKCVNCSNLRNGKAKRTKNMIQNYFYDLDKKLADGEVMLTSADEHFMEEYNIYDKVLVDVPCTFDRVAVSSDENNFFHGTKVKDRISLPEVQADILMKALKLVKPGGTVVYCTSSLSPVQNDGVVKMVLKSIATESDMKIAVVDMKKALEPAKVIFRLGSNIGLKYGHLVLPYLPANYGPKYFCKFIKL